MIDNIYEIYLQSKGVSIDSRSVQNGVLFFALKGTHVDGNSFADSVVGKGAIAIIDNPLYAGHENCILVENVLETLTDLARIHRNNLKTNVLGITGTNGKTTTKELVAKVLSSHFKTYATEGNLNNHIGVPLTILRTPTDTEWLIVEMGANHIGEIAYLSNIAQPQYAVITNVGQAHLEGFGSPEGVFKAKTELYHYIKRNGKQIFVNSDDKMLYNSTLDFSTYTYGTKNGDVIGHILNPNNPMQIQWSHQDKIFNVQSHLFGSYNLWNILAAIAIGTYAHVPYEKINKAVEMYYPDNNRSQYVSTIKGNTIILDAYNANPSSMNLAIRDFLKLQGTDKMFILGSMLELGAYSEEKHAEIIDYLVEQNVKPVIFIGMEFYILKSNYKSKGYVFLKNIDDAKRYLESNIITNATILMKGSRGIAIEKLLPYL
jgi:UDP-N-acetylmuramoyl-tripeptide--D-alanyl-D-alanine ligase